MQSIDNLSNLEIYKPTPKLAPAPPNETCKSETIKMIGIINMSLTPVEFELQKGKCPNYKIEFCLTPLKRQARNNKIQTSAKDQAGTALHTAIFVKNFTLASHIVACYPSTSDLINSAGLTPLSFLMREKSFDYQQMTTGIQLDFLKLLLSTGADPNYRRNSDPSHVSPFFLACQSGDIECAKLLKYYGGENKCTFTSIEKKALVEQAFTSKGKMVYEISKLFAETQNFNRALFLLEPTNALAAAFPKEIRNEIISLICAPNRYAYELRQIRRQLAPLKH